MGYGAKGADGLGRNLRYCFDGAGNFGLKAISSMEGFHTHIVQGRLFLACFISYFFARFIGWGILVVVYVVFLTCRLSTKHVEERQRYPWISINRIF